ncbi:hypothetical protein BT96DRAFT_1041316, partial [Gymnopus androsaceus JB14]
MLFCVHSPSACFPMLSSLLLDYGLYSRDTCHWTRHDFECFMVSLGPGLGTTFTIAANNLGASLFALPFYIFRIVL